jgi:prepilin-type N-terminal cleavage/methylation domain-containing protein
MAAVGVVSLARTSMTAAKIGETRRARMADDERRGFTLVELIVVMAMLAAIMSVAAPRLSRFFAGRGLDLEAGRLLALTRYSQNHAVSSGYPMVLWIDVNQGAYGMREQSTFRPGDQTLQSRMTFLDEYSAERPLQYFLAKDLELYLDNQERHTNGVATIIFYPDGSIDENSLKLFFIRDKDQKAVPLVQTRNRMHYEISDQTNRWTGAIR